MDITESFGIALEDSGFDVVVKRETSIKIQNGCALLYPNKTKFATIEQFGILFKV